MADDPPEEPTPDPEPEPEPEPDPPNYDSILLSVKKLLGIDPAYTQFDQEIIIYINSAFVTLNQLGVGPSEGFSITDDTAEWDDFDDGIPVNMVKTYIYLKVRLIFDPPQTGYLVEAITKQILECEWRLNDWQTIIVEGGEADG